MIQKGFHPGGGFLCRCALEKIIGAEHHKENIHRHVFGEQTECMWIMWNLPAIGTSIDAFMTRLLHQQVNPTILSTITVTKESSGIVAVSIGISKTQYPHCNHL